MDKIQGKELDPYSRMAVAAILARFPDWESHAQVDANGSALFELACPSRAALKGLWVSTDGEELTVAFHTHHTHFTNYDGTSPLPQIEQGVAHIADILAERMGVASWYRDDSFACSFTVELPYKEPLTSLIGGPAADLLRSCSRAALCSWQGTFDREERVG